MRQQNEFDLILWTAQQGPDSSLERLLIRGGAWPGINQNPGMGVRTPYQPSCCWHLHVQAIFRSHLSRDGLVVLSHGFEVELRTGRNGAGRSGKSLRCRKTPGLSSSKAVSLGVPGCWDLSSTAIANPAQDTSSGPRPSPTIPPVVSAGLPAGSTCSTAGSSTFGVSDCSFCM